MDSFGVIQRFGGGRTWEMASEAEPPVESAYQVLAHDWIIAAMQSLPEQWQATLWHVEVLGRTPGETAPFLGIHDGAVIEVLVQAREGLRQAYEQQDPAV